MCQSPFREATIKWDSSSVALTLGTILRNLSHIRFSVSTAFSQDAMFSIGLSPPPNLDSINILEKCWDSCCPSVSEAQRRTRMENAVPTKPENKANIKYNVPLEMEPVSRPDPLKEPNVPVTWHSARSSTNGFPCFQCYTCNSGLH